jgi:hypothetical protein
MSVAFMQEHRLVEARGKLQLCPECGDLRLRGREVAEIVQATLAHCSDFRLHSQSLQFGERRLIQVRCVMRVNARRAAKAPRVLADEIDGGARARNRAAGDDHAGDADGGRALKHLRTIAVETVVRKVDPYIDEWSGPVSRPWRIAERWQWGICADAALCYRSRMNCSATPGRVVTRVVAARVLNAALCCLFLAATARGTSLAELDDSAARIQYAFYTADAQALTSVLTLVESFTAEPALAASQAYQLAYGHWKLAQLHLALHASEASRSPAKSQAAQAARNCLRHAKAASALDPTIDEVYAIEAACAALVPGGRIGSDGCAGHKALRKAASLGPHNPRIKFIEALCATGPSPDPASTKRWRAVVADFEAAAPAGPGRPDWGHAEALILLGEACVRNGTIVEAREALERALVLAPDYHHAQRMLETLAVGAR